MVPPLRSIATIFSTSSIIENFKIQIYAIFVKKTIFPMQQQNSYKVGIFTIGILFFIFGFITWLNATLIPYLKVACELTNFQSYFVTFAFYISYFVMALPSARVLKQTGLKSGMMIGLMVMSAGALIFIPAALLRTYPLFLLGLFVMGTGLALLQTAANPYVAVLGPMESAAQRISIMGICNKVAGMLSPLIVGSILFQKMDSLELSIQIAEGASRAAELDTLAHKAILPYLIIMLALLGLAFFVKYSPLPDIDAEESAASKGDKNDYAIFRYPHFWFGVLALFLYVGVEVIAIDTISLYGNSLGYSLELSKAFPSYPLFAMILGYVIGIAAIPRYISQARALTICAALGVIFTVAAVSTTGAASVTFIALLGLANSLMWPAIFPLAIDKLGRHTKTGSAILIMAIAGGATLPLLYGHLADSVGNQQAYLLMAPCYAVILLFAVAGHKIKPTASART